jgi:hypothetical protein
LTKESTAFVQAVPRRCILRDLSFSGAKLIMMGVAKFLIDKEVGLRVDFDDPKESFLVKGKFIRAESVEGKKEMIALAIEFDEAIVPMGYKIRINEFLSTVRADSRIGGPSAESPAANAGREKVPAKKAEGTEAAPAPPGMGGDPVPAT